MGGVFDTIYNFFAKFLGRMATGVTSNDDINAFGMWASAR